MPTYEYQCEKCDEIFEFFHSISQEPLTECPDCNEDTLIRLISGGGAVIIKGTQTPCHGGREIQPDKPKRDRLGEGKYKNTDIPWWRSSPTINKKILKNPEKYIKEGKVE